MGPFCENSQQIKSVEQWKQLIKAGIMSNGHVKSQNMMTTAGHRQNTNRGKPQT